MTGGIFQAVIDRTKAGKDQHRFWGEAEGDGTGRRIISDIGAECEFSQVERERCDCRRQRTECALVGFPALQLCYRRIQLGVVGVEIGA